MTTAPEGYSNLIEWTGTGGCSPASQSGGATFTTKWSCIGSKTVTASLCGTNAPKNVTVVLAEGDEMAGSHDSSVHWPDDIHNFYVCTGEPQDWSILQAIGGYMGVMLWKGREGDKEVPYDVKFKYSNCSWICELSNVQVNATILVYDPECGDIALESVSSASEIPCVHQDTAVSDLFDPDLLDDQPANTNPSMYWCHDGARAHEEKHLADWKDYLESRLNDAIDYCEGLCVAIDCENEGTYTGETAYWQWEYDIKDEFDDAIDAAHDAFDDPNTTFRESEQRALYVQGWNYQIPIICELWLLCD